MWRLGVLWLCARPLELKQFGQGGLKARHLRLYHFEATDVSM
jgi:hypothetical protein